jgi:hypothetical protein
MTADFLILIKKKKNIKKNNYKKDLRMKKNLIFFLDY